MSLDTRIVVRSSRLSARTVLAHLSALLCDDGIVADVTDEWNAHSNTPPQERTLRHVSAAGCMAAVIVEYHPDGPMLHRCDPADLDCSPGPTVTSTVTGRTYAVTPEDHARHLTDVVTDPTMNGWATMSVTLCTSGSSYPDRPNRADVHAYLVRELARFIGDRGQLLWCCMSDAVWHPGADHHMRGDAARVDDAAPGDRPLHALR